jgi:hypothetical protein
MNRDFVFRDHGTAHGEGAQGGLPFEVADGLPPQLGDDQCGRTQEEVRTASSCVQDREFFGCLEWEFGGYSSLRYRFVAETSLHGAYR